MPKNLFMIRGNICGERIRQARFLQNPPMKREALAREMQLKGMDITPIIISRIESGQRHVCDAELLMFSKVRGFPMEWLCGEGDIEITITMK